MVLSTGTKGGMAIWLLLFLSACISNATGCGPATKDDVRLLVVLLVDDIFVELYLCNCSGEKFIPVTFAE